MSWLFDADADTVAVRAVTLSMSSSTAVIVTVSEALDVLPAAIVIVASAPTV